MNYSIEKYLKSEEFFRIQGYDWLSNSIPLLLTTPLSIIGILMNLIAIFIINKMKENEFYAFKLIKIIYFHSCWSNLIYSITFYIHSSRLIGYRFDFMSRFIECILCFYVATGLYWVETILDIVLSIERLSVFIESIKQIKRMNVYLLYVSTLFVCFLLNLPSLFGNYVLNDTEMNQQVLDSFNNSTQVIRCKNILNGDLNYLILLNVLLRDLLSLLIQVGLAISILVYYIRLQTKKALIQLNQSNTIHPNVLKAKKRESKFTLITLILVFLSILSHLIVLSLFIFNLFSPNPYSTQYLGITAILLSSLKNFCNFLITYFVISKFRVYFKKMIKQKNNDEVSLEFETNNHIN